MMSDELRTGAFMSFRALNEEVGADETEQLFRNLARLFALVADRCDAEQIGQYDTVLCRLVDGVSLEARAFAAGLLAPLPRAPGSILIRMAGDEIEVARPLLESSPVLTDDDLIGVAETGSEEHRIAVAGRNPLSDRVAEAIAAKGASPSVTTLVNNSNARLSPVALEQLALKATSDDVLATELRARGDIDWKAALAHMGPEGRAALEQLPIRIG